MRGFAKTRLPSGVVANNPGQLALSWPVPVSGGQGWNVMNHACAAFYAVLNVKPTDGLPPS